MQVLLVRRFDRDAGADVGGDEPVIEHGYVRMTPTTRRSDM
jgi:hypothetical protein